MFYSAWSLLLYSLLLPDSSFHQSWAGASYINQPCGRCLETTSFACSVIAGGSDQFRYAGNRFFTIETLSLGLGCLVHEKQNYQVQRFNKWRKSNGKAWTGHPIRMVKTGCVGQKQGWTFTSRFWETCSRCCTEALDTRDFLELSLNFPRDFYAISEIFLRLFWYCFVIVSI